MKNLVLCLMLVTGSSFLFAQDEAAKSECSSHCLQSSISADVVSQYVWRGVQLNDIPSLQPNLSLSCCNFEFGFWGSVPFAQSAVTTTENDLYIKYKHECKCGEFSITATDYYFSSANLSYANYRNKNEGAHTVDVNLSFTGNENLPLTFQFSGNVYNDTCNAMYLEAGYQFKAGENDFAFTVGGTFNQNDWYQTTDDKFQIINIGLSASKTIKITDNFSMPFSVAYIMNPSAEKSYLVVKTSFGI